LYDREYVRVRYLTKGVTMVDFKFLRDRGEPLYLFSALVQDFHDQPAVWTELIFKGYNEADCISTAVHLRDTLYPLGVRVIEIASGDVIYEAKELTFGDRVRQAGKKRS
jgi:hypothetical protein